MRFSLVLVLFLSILSLPIITGAQQNIGGIGREEFTFNYDFDLASRLGLDKPVYEDLMKLFEQRGIGGLESRLAEIDRHMGWLREALVRKSFTLIGNDYKNIPKTLRERRDEIRAALKRFAEEKRAIESLIAMEEQLTPAQREAMKAAKEARKAREAVRRKRVTPAKIPRELKETAGRAVANPATGLVCRALRGAIRVVAGPEAICFDIASGMAHLAMGPRLEEIKGWQTEPFIKAIQQSMGKEGLSDEYLKELINNVNIDPLIREAARRLMIERILEKREADRIEGERNLDNYMRRIIDEFNSRQNSQ